MPYDFARSLPYGSQALASSDQNRENEPLLLDLFGQEGLINAIRNLLLGEEIVRNNPTWQ